MPKNPHWTRDEVILALDLYFQGGRCQLPADHPEVIELSNLLQTLPLHPPNTRKPNFRSPDSISMKLANFLKYDPQYPGVGLERGSSLGEAVWEDFADNPDRLHAVATTIRNSFRSSEAQYLYFSDPADEEFVEGKILTRIHKQRERNPRLVKRKKDAVMRDTGRLACEVCGFDFNEVYGEWGHGFAECHHLVPLSKLNGSRRTRLSDLAIVCANCHRMLHKSKHMMAVQELRKLVENNRRLG